jgi:hypothetical protein
VTKRSPSFNSGGRVTYQTLQRHFALLDERALTDLKDERLFSHPEIADEEERGLVWTDQGSPTSSVPSLGSEQVQSPKPVLSVIDGSKVQSLKSKVEEAEECFHKAIQIARRQQAKSLELRAVMSLVRLWQQEAVQHPSRNTHHGTRMKLDEAHRTLSEVYDWFTEGFDTKDLQEAKTLLESLGSGV